MESSAIAMHIPHTSKKRVFPGSSSGGGGNMEPDVIEIAPPSSNQRSKRKAKGKQKQVADHEIIDLDLDEDRDDGSNKKMKKSLGISLDHSIASEFDSKSPINFAKKAGSSKNGKGVLVEPGHYSDSFTRGSNNFFDLDDYVFDDEFSLFEDINFPTGVEAPIPSLPDLLQMKSQSQPTPVDPLSTFTWLHSSEQNPAGLAGQNTGNGPIPTPSPTLKRKRQSSLVGSSSSKARVDKDGALKRFESFKKFDTVVDFSDHYYATHKKAMKQPPKNWAKKIQDEWRILEKDLPDTIFVRAYESRMDLLRAVIIGAEGTPYHDGLFIFDVCFPSSYPNTPPLVNYRSGGLRINPNLYNCGKVCLSLLNTWSGGRNEKWVPGKSTMLQVLVSIQGLILNTKPYFNEPGWAPSSGSVHGEKASVAYNESTLILSLKTMVYTMNGPPKNFEDLVVGHFRTRARDILMACKAYTEGVQVGCLVRGGVQDLDEGDNNSCSTNFKNNVASYIKTLINAFKKIGANEADEFMSISEKKSPLPPASSAPNLTFSLGHTPFQFMAPVMPAFNQHW